MKTLNLSPAPSLPPTLYHLTQVENWPSIEQHGLLSTQALLDLAKLSDEERKYVGNQHRAQCVMLPNGVMISDQKPMPPTALARCLQGVTPEQWYALLNSKVFFWPDVERLHRLRRVYKALSQVVMVIDTKRLLARHAERIALTPINTGNARRRPALRSPHTFVPYTTWLESSWNSETEALHSRPRSRTHKPAELVVSYAVPDVMNCLIEVQHLGPQETLHL